MLIYAIIFLFLAQIALVLLKPEWGVYLIALTLPIIGKEFYLGSLAIPLADLVALATLLAFVISYLFRLFFPAQEKNSELSWPLFFPFALFLGLSALSIIVNGSELNAWYYFLRWPVFLYFAYIFVPANIIKEPKVLKKTVIFVALSSFLVLFSGYLSLVGQDWYHSFFRLKSVYFWQSYPFGENHNLIAEYLNIGTFFILVIKEFVKDLRLRRLIDVLFLASVLGIILTFSRSGWITLGIQLVVYAYYRLRHFPKEKSSLVGLLILLAIVASPLFIKMSQLQSGNVSSTASRLVLTEIAWAGFQERPLFGFGSGSYVKLVGQDIRYSAKYGEPIDSHGAIQKIIVENGIFALLAWIFLLLYLLRFCFFTLRKYYPQVPWVLPFFLAAAGGIFFQFFNTSYYKGKVWFPVLLFILAIKLSEKKHEPKNKVSSYPTQS